MVQVIRLLVSGNRSLAEGLSVDGWKSHRVALMLLDWAESVTKQGAHDRAAPLLREAVAIAVDLPARNAAVAAQCRLR
ncbi:MAG: hypothetical protein KDA33_08615, partial [Phycisphaerales bacterium]|nr:hypothetical protein [Phycisphaerales bacterium]